MNWKDVTIGMLQQIAKLPEDLSTVERAAYLVSIIKGIPYEQVSKWSIDKFSDYDFELLSDMPKSKLKFKFQHKGKRFRLVRSANKMSAHHFIELQELGDVDKVEILHQIIACLSYRVNIFGRKIEDDYEWKVANFKDLPCSQFYRYALFFSKLYPRLLKDTLTYLKQEKAKVQQTYSDGSASSTD